MLRISKLFQCQFRCIYSTAPLSRKGFSGGQRTRKLISGKGGQLNESGDRKSEMLQYKIAEDLSKAIKKGNYDQIISSKDQSGSVSLKTKKGKNLQRTDEIRQERAKARPPVWAKISTRAYEDDNHLNLCVKKLIRAYQQRISDGRSFPKMAEMSVNMEVVIPYGTPDHERFRLESVKGRDLDKEPAISIMRKWTEILVENDFHVKRSERDGHKKWALIVAPNNSFILKHSRAKMEK